MQPVRIFAKVYYETLDSWSIRKWWPVALSDLLPRKSGRAIPTVPAMLLSY